jgi:hypothetical protein
MKIGRVPQVRPSVSGPKTICFDCLFYPRLGFSGQHRKNLWWASPVFFVPGTLGRTWGTRPIPIWLCWDTEPGPRTYSLRLNRRAMVANSLGRTLGRVHGHTAMQIPHEADSAKYGMHLSKSTYQRSTPRTICLSAVIAP